MSENKTPRTDKAEFFVNSLETVVRSSFARQLETELQALEKQFEDRTNSMIIHRGAAIACSESAKEAYTALEKQNQDLRTELTAAREALAEYGYIVSFLKGASSRYLMTPSCNNEKELRAAIGTNLTLPLPPQAASEQEGE